LQNQKKKGREKVWAVLLLPSVLIALLTVTRTDVFSVAKTQKKEVL